MSKRKGYSPEYKRELVELVRRSQSSGRQIALEVGVNPNLLTRWGREADAGGGKAFPGVGMPRDEELARLKRELTKVTRAWACRTPGPRARANARLLDRVREIHETAWA